MYVKENNTGRHYEGQILKAKHWPLGTKNEAPRDIQKGKSDRENISLIAKIGQCPSSELSWIWHTEVKAWLKKHFIYCKDRSVSLKRTQPNLTCKRKSVIERNTSLIPKIVQCPSSELIWTYQQECKQNKTPEWTTSLSHLDSVVVGDDVCYVESDVKGGLQHLHLHLHVAQDAEVAVDEWLQLHQVMEWAQGSREAHVQLLLQGRRGAEGA